MPKLGQLVKRILSDKPLTFKEKLEVIKDMHAHYMQDFDVIYLPGGEPVDGRCPVSTCSKFINQ
jgi:hypothetical protein